jgi:hypothetical protein
MLYIQYEVEQALFQGQLGQLPRNVVCFLGGPRMTNDGGDHKLCQLFKLSRIEIGQRFEQTWCGPQGRQDVSHTNVKVHRLFTTFFQLCWWEKLLSVDTCDYGLHCNLMFDINLIKELIITT